MKNLHALIISYVILLVIVPRLLLSPLTDALHIDYYRFNEWYFLITTFLLAGAAIKIFLPQFKQDWSMVQHHLVKWPIISFLAFCAGLILNVIIALLINGTKAAESHNQQTLENLADPAAAFLFPLLIVIFGPILEEVIFRGYLIGEFRRKIPIILLIILSALLFTLIHANTLAEWKSLTPYFSLGVCSSVLYVWKRNIFYPLLLHMINNLFAQLIIWFA